MLLGIAHRHWGEVFEIKSPIKWQGVIILWQVLISNNDELIGIIQVFKTVYHAHSYQTIHRGTI